MMLRSAGPDDHTDRGVVHDYRVFYPSGTRFTLRGVFCALALEGRVDVGIRVDERFWLLDPRAVIVRDDLVIYEPRARAATLTADMRAWLAEHPEWPRVATEAAP